jgi:hypothetical protein
VMRWKSDNSPHRSLHAHADIAVGLRHPLHAASASPKLLVLSGFSNSPLNAVVLYCWPRNVGWRNNAQVEATMPLCDLKYGVSVNILL